MTPLRDEPDHEPVRWAALRELEEWLEGPMRLLGFVWLLLLVLDLSVGLTPVFQTLTFLIWLVFMGDFGLRLALAPNKRLYLQTNWLTALSLGVPALRVLRIGRAVPAIRTARAARGLRLVSLIGSMNRGMRALQATMRRRGVGYVAALTVAVLLAGGAGMYAFEREVPDRQGLQDFPTALWWTAMVITTMGSGYWPVTPEGRLLCLFLAIYAFAVFGYVTATIAAFFIGRDVEHGSVPASGEAGSSLQSLEQELRSMRAELAALREQPSRRETGS